MLRRIGNTSIGRSVLLKNQGASSNLRHQPETSLRYISTVAKRAAPASLPALDITLAARPKKVAKRPAARKTPVPVEVPQQDPAIPDVSRPATNVTVHAAAEDGDSSLSSPIETDASDPQPPGPDLWGAAEADNGWSWKAHHQIPIPEEFNEPPAEGSQPEVRAEGSQPEVAEQEPPEPLEQTAGTPSVGADAAEVLAMAATLISLAPPHGDISRVDRYEREHSAELLGNVPQQFFQDGRGRRRRSNEDGSAQFKATSFDRSPGRPPVVCWICQRKNRASSTTCNRCGSGLRDDVALEAAQDQSYDMPPSSSDADIVNTQPAQQHKAGGFPFDDDVRIRRRRVSTQQGGGDNNHSHHNDNSQYGRDGYGRGDDGGRHQHQPSRGGPCEGYHRNQNNDRSQYQGGGGGDSGHQRQASYQQHRSSPGYGQGSEGQQRYQPGQQNQYRSGQQQYQGRQQYQSGQDRQQRQSNYQNNGLQQYQPQNSSRQQYQPRRSSPNRGYPSGRQEGGGGQQHSNQQPAQPRRPQMPPPVNL